MAYDDAQLSKDGFTISNAGCSEYRGCPLCLVLNKLSIFK